MDVILLFDMSQVYGIVFVDLNFKKGCLFLSIIYKKQNDNEHIDYNPDICGE